MVCCAWSTCLACTATVLAVLFIMYRLFKLVRFLVNVSLFVSLVLSLAVVDIVIALVLAIWRRRLRDMRTTEIMSPIFKRIMAWLGVEVRVLAGAEYFEMDRACVVVSNHQSILDLAAMLGAWPIKTAAVAKREIFCIPIFGIAAYLNGTIFINRQDGLGARRKLNATFAEMIKRRVRKNAHIACRCCFVCCVLSTFAKTIIGKGEIDEHSRYLGV